MSHCHGLFVTVGPMGTGKTHSLLLQVGEYKRHNLHPLVIVPSSGANLRFGATESIPTSDLFKLRCRLGLEHDAITLNTHQSIRTQIASHNFDALFVDEAQFLETAQVLELVEIAYAQKKMVKCYGLLSDFYGSAFPAAADLISYATATDFLSTLCKCGRSASMNVRTDVSSRTVVKPRVSVGESIEYHSVCPSCFVRHWR